MDSATRADEGLLPPQAHVCGTFQTAQQLHRTLGAFFRAGLVDGETCMIALDTAEPDDVLAAIGSPADIAAWETAGRLAVRIPPGPEEARQDLTFQQMLDVWNELIEMARSGRVRLGGEASWWLYQASQDRLLRYEAEMNRTIPDQLAVLCLYDLNRFGTGVLLDVVQAHPHALMDELIIENPYYIEPGAFLASRHSGRRSGSPTPGEAFLTGTS